MVRHGQTDYNKKGIIQGSGIDASLNETGQRQAISFFDAYRHIPFEKIYISTLRRTQESVQAFIDLGIPYEKLPGLNEINWGVAEGTAFASGNDHEYMKLVDQWKAGNVDQKVEGGESPREALTRLVKAFRYILSNEDENTVLVCMHGRVIRILLTWVNNMSLSQMDSFMHDNLGLYLLNYDGKKFGVENMNDISHLAEMNKS